MFDKTGTITHGIPKVARVAYFVDEKILGFLSFLAIVGSAEASSEHPLASAIVKYCQKVSYSPYLKPSLISYKLGLDLV